MVVGTVRPNRRKPTRWSIPTWDESTLWQNHKNFPVGFLMLNHNWATKEFFQTRPEKFSHFVKEWWKGSSHCCCWLGRQHLHQNTIFCMLCSLNGKSPQGRKWRKVQQDIQNLMMVLLVWKVITFCIAAKGFLFSPILSFCIYCLGWIFIKFEKNFKLIWCSKLVFGTLKKW